MLYRKHKDKIYGEFKLKCYEKKEKMDCDDEPYGAPQYLGRSNTGESGTLDARSVFRCGQCCLDDYGHNLCFDDDSRPFLFLWRYGGPEEYHFHHFAELYRHGRDQCDLGCGRIQSGFWRRLALTGALFLGRRKNAATPHVPANIPFVVLGAAMLWLGWFGFNAGSSLAADGIAVKAFLNTNTASATAMMTWLFFDCLRGRKPSAMGAAVGAVVGLVAITPSAGYVTVGESIMIAFLTTLVCNIAVYWKNKTHVDDALDVFPTHGVGGIFGTILTGVFVYGLLDGNIHMFLIHLLAVVIVCGYTFVVSYILYWLTNKMIPMRVSPESEAAGLDKSQHDECYGNG